MRRHNRLVRVVRSFVAVVFFRAQWRTALRRIDIDATCVAIVSVKPRGDGHALTVRVESRTKKGADLCSEIGVPKLAWALRRRVVLLGGSAYEPSLHTLLIERAPLIVGDMPIPQLSWLTTPLRIQLGCDATTGDVASIELWSKERGSSHVLISGTTGGGKSNTVNVLVTGLVGSGVCIVGLDCKAGETLGPWEHLLGHAVIDPNANPVAADDILARLVEIMERRHRCVGPNYRAIVLVVEEWASLPTKPLTMGDNLERLAAQGRSASIGVILTTQRPTSNVGAVRTSTRGNLSVRIAHSTVGDRAASEAILGGGIYTAADLPTDPPGYALLRIGGNQPQSVRIFHCPGPPWKPGDVYTETLDEVAAWDQVAQREMERERIRHALAIEQALAVE